MRLQSFYQASRQAKENDTFLAYGIDAIAEDKELSGHIQEILIWLKLLEPPVDGLFGSKTTKAFVNFQDITTKGSNWLKSLNDQEQKEFKAEKGFLGFWTAKALIETKPEDIERLIKIVNTDANDLAARIIKYMQKSNYTVSTGKDNYNIVYVEGINTDGSLNDDAKNQFNDVRIVIEIPDSVPKIKGIWEGTTEPGTYYTNNPISEEARRKGAARIAFGQYKSWQVGTHGNAEPHEALVQAKEVSVYRDKNRDMKRPGDFLDTGLFGINQHWGYDYTRTDISLASAGCLVGRTRQGHREFMRIIKEDNRYQDNSKYIFYSTIIAGDDLAKQFPIS